MRSGPTTAPRAHRLHLASLFPASDPVVDPSRGPVSARRAVTACSVAGLSAVLALVGVAPARAAVVDTTTASCVDGGGTTWRTEVRWGAAYKPAGSGSSRVAVDFAGWTTNARSVPTDSTVTTYSDGAVSQRLDRTATKDYQNGTSFDARNPANPVSAPGATKITVSVGRDGDGKGSCTATHLQPGKPTTTPPTTGSAAVRTLGTPRSGLGWHSGAWVGGRFNTRTINDFGTWRGRPTDIVTTYSPRDSYSSIMSNTWSITTWEGFQGKLQYGLALIPNDGSGSFSSIAAGKQDQVWRKVAANLEDNGRGDSVVRVGWEVNLPDWRWATTASNAPEFRAAFRRVVQTMRAVAPNLKFDFGIGCGSPLKGGNDRLSALTTLYPGDDVVDIVGCDTYDWWNTHATSDATWGNVLHPSYGPGIEDVVKFARAHGKGASFPEWGLARKENGNGGGDNPYYIEAMFGFFQANRDVVAYECYFDEPDSYIKSSLYGAGQNPRSAAVYRRLW